MTRDYHTLVPQQLERPLKRQNWEKYGESREALGSTQGRGSTIIELHGRGVPEVVPDPRSPHHGPTRGRV